MSAATWGDLLQNDQKRREWLLYVIRGLDILYLSSTAEKLRTGEEHALAQTAERSIIELAKDVQSGTLTNTTQRTPWHIQSWNPDA